MLSPIPASTRFVVSPYAATTTASASVNLPSFRSLVSLIEPKKRRKRGEEELSSSVNFVVPKEPPFLGFSNSRGRGQDCSWRRCKVWDGEGDLGLEAEILEFMKKSENPLAFPTKKQLVDAERMDLVEAISRLGGWLSWGWDDGGDKDVFVSVESVDINWESYGLEGRVSSSSSAANSSHLASSSGRSLEMTSEDDIGIEGILSRLEKQRNVSLGLGLEEKENKASISSNDRKEWQPRTPDKVADIERTTSLRPKKGKLNDLDHNLGENGSFTNYSGWRNSSKPEMWRMWSIERAGNQGMDFEVGEIAFNQSRMGDATDALKDGILSTTGSSSEAVDKRKELNSCGKEGNHNEIQSRLQQLELDLSSILHLVRLKSNVTISQGDQDCFSDDLEKVSDAWEFQENEVMNALSCLRSIQAQLAVLEGKMALAIIDAQKNVEEKQKRINGACKALQLLRTACIVWPNSASEVLLAGSYDGWATQRKMERSSTGVFSLFLKMYPGRYEIKFIVDGTWSIDPLRPIVNNNGYENNLLIIT